MSPDSRYTIVTKYIKTISVLGAARGYASHRTDGSKQSLGQLANRAAYGGERFILEFRGKPRAAIVSYEDLERLQEMNSASLSRREVLERADELRKEIFARTGVLSDSVSAVRRLRQERDEQISGLR